MQTLLRHAKVTHVQYDDPWMECVAASYEFYSHEARFVAVRSEASRTFESAENVGKSGCKLSRLGVRNECFEKRGRPRSF